MDMLNYLKTKTKYALKLAFVMSPCIFSMYLLYYLEKNQVWIPQTLHRDKMTIAILATGLILSFLLKTYISKREQK